MGFSFGDLGYVRFTNKEFDDRVRFEIARFQSLDIAIFGRRGLFKV